MDLAEGRRIGVLGRRKGCCRAPPIISVRHHADMKAVVDYMVKLADDDELYEQHMEWKQEPFEPGFVRTVNAGRSKMFCNICDKTAEMKMKRQQQSAPIRKEL